MTATTLSATVAPRPVYADDFIGENGKQLGLSDNCITVLKQRYLKKNPDGKCCETPEEMFRRVAKAVASAEAKFGATPQQVAECEQEFYELMISGKFEPNSPTLMNAGREMGMLSACFVLPIGDSIDEIFDTVKHTALIQKAGGGTGFSFDRLRPSGDWIKSSGGTTSGPISFWRVLSEATNAIQQGAFRRGANMGMLSIDHCDIIKFLYAKQDLSKFQNYNISVKVSDAWMKSYHQNPNTPHIVRNFRSGAKYVIPKNVNMHTYQVADLIPMEGWESYDHDNDGIGMRNGEKIEVWTRKQVWDTIVENAWKTGEPGVCFFDRINAVNPTPNVGEMEATNPCGEQPLLPYEACNLGSINLSAFTSFNPNSSCDEQLDWDGLRRVVHQGTRFLEDVVEVNNYVIPQIDKICKGNRKIGLGLMGFADMLYKLGIPYNSDAGVAMGEKVMKFINDEAHNESERLAEERGVFSNWEGSRWDTQWKRKQRNACSTTVAPTGTISIIANCSGGIEPLFCLSFMREVMRDHTGKPKRMTEVNEIFREVAKAHKFWGLDEEVLFKRVITEGTLHDIAEIPEAIKRVFVCAHDITPEWHVRMQAAFQRHCDSSISKTTNFPNSATPDDVRKVYDLAYELGCKGVTVYRDGCRALQPMALEKPKTEAAAPVPATLTVKKMPEILPAFRIRQNTPFGNMHVNITYDPTSKRDMEIFAQLGKGGDIAAADLEAICRVSSLYLRSGGDLAQVVDQLEDIGSHMTLPTKDGQVKSLGDGLAKGIKRYLESKASLTPAAPAINLNAALPRSPSIHASNAVNVAYRMKCPECGGNIIFQEQCQKCSQCTYSKC